MISKVESKSKVLRFLNVIYGDFQVLIMDNKTIENRDFFVFFYNSKEYLVNMDSSSALAGNGGIIVDRTDGSMYRTGTSQPIEYYTTEFKRDKNSLDKINFE